MKNFLSFAVLLLSLSAHAQLNQRAYPMGPDASLTPGSLCDRPTSRRYPENIAYCERDVTGETKDYVFKQYAVQLGYTLGDRHKNFKIDHFIPLCAGGSNYEDNLWPQNISIYLKTDPMEELGCKKLSLGLIKQAELVSLIKATKRNIALLPQTMRKLNSL
jgi:hypothetical protein